MQKCADELNRGNVHLFQAGIFLVQLIDGKAEVQWHTYCLKIEKLLENVKNVLTKSTAVSSIHTVPTGPKQ